MERRERQSLGFVVKSTMKNLEQQFSLTMSGHKPQSSNSVREYSDPIPVDLLINIFSRLDAKSIARFRCVSKLWGSILIRSDFTELFFTKSWTRPRLLFALRSYSYQRKNELLFYSLPQPQNQDGTNSCAVATRYNRPFQCHSYDEYTSLCGLVLSQNFCKIKAVRTICNPVTGESITLPSVEENFEHFVFGYDPINKQFKVLCITSETPSSNQILTLKTGELKWRKIECKPHFILYNTSVCISGVLYYSARTDEESFVIVCFDVRSEKFRFINIDANMLPGPQWYLVNYKGKLGAQIYKLHSECYFAREEFVMWVLEDTGNHTYWSKHVYVMSPLWNQLAYGMKIIGMTCTGEIVFTVPFIHSKPFYVYFYNLERSIFTRVEVQFQGVKQVPCVSTFLDYVENFQVLR